MKPRRTRRFKKLWHTSRRSEILALLAFGLRPKEIAHILRVTVGTIWSHMSAIYRIYGVTSCREAIAKFVREVRARSTDGPWGWYHQEPSEFLQITYYSIPA